MIRKAKSGIDGIEAGGRNTCSPKRYLYLFIYTGTV
jgi:hypothetical protein